MNPKFDRVVTTLKPFSTKNHIEGEKYEVHYLL